VKSLTAGANVTVTDLGNGVWEIAATAGGGGISEITSTGDTVDITDPEGPTVNLEVSGGGGGLPDWFQSGAGAPTAENPVPEIFGALYFDTENGGLYMSPDGTNWAGFSAPFSNEDGLVISPVDFALFNPAGTVGIASYSYNGSLQITTPDVGAVSLFINAGSPIGSVTPSEAGDVCIDITTPGMWQATGIENTDWAQFGGVLPTADPHQAGSFWSNLGIVTVSAG
jgi:hypothetical protein